MKGKALFALLVLVFVVLVTGMLWFCAMRSVTTVILVRHAEKQQGDNPSLTEAGWVRAGAIIDVAATSGVVAIYSTEFCRTVQTAVPLASHLDLPIYVQEIRGGEPGIDTCQPPVEVPVTVIRTQDDYYEELVNRVLVRHAGKTVLIVGHSNTVPKLVEAFGAGPVAEIPETDYDNLFIVTVPRPFGTARVIKATYGAPRSGD